MTDIDPNTPEAIAQRKAEIAEMVKKAKRDVAAILTTHPDRIACFEAERTPDCSPRYEAVVYPIYLGIWLYQDGDEKRWTVESDEVDQESGWLEDHVHRAEPIQHASFRTFKEALGAANQVIEALAQLPGFDNI